MTLTRPVVLKGRRAGSLTIVYDLGELTERIRIWGGIILAVMILSSLAAVLLSSRFRTLLAAPVLELARTAGVVSNTKNYEVRADQTSADEIGQLASAFNEMLAGIGSRDADLRRTLLEREQALEKLAEVNRELHRSNEELNSRNQDLERFAFIASHDMQEPARMVSIYSELLVKRCGDLNDELTLYRDYVISGTTRMRDLIADLLSYIEVTTSPDKKDSVDLKIVLERVQQNLKMIIDESGSVVTAGPLPVVEGHETQIMSLFQNLIVNAIKYRGEQPPLIHITAEPAGPMYQLSVTDNGTGIPSEYQSQIFVPFKRLHGNEIPGTGIGLAICQRIVERYGGRIWVESKVGKGSCFRFTLRAAGESAASAATAPLSRDSLS